MRSIILAFVAFFFVASANAQDAKKALKTAQKDLATYYKDQVGNAGKLQSAIDMITKAFEDQTIQADPESWVVKAEIYNTISDAEIKQKLINPKYEFKNIDAANIAFEASKKAIELSPKKNKGAIAALVETEAHLNNYGISAFQVEDFKNAYSLFNNALKSFDLLKANGQSSRLDDATALSEQKYFTAVAGYYANVGQEIVPLLKDIATAGTDKSFVYEALFGLLIDTDEATASKYLTEGRTKFPDESNLLFAEINHYLKKGKLNELVDKLKQAIAAEPSNVSVYVTLGNVYDQLVTKEREAGNSAKSEEYFNSALDYYSQASKIDANNFDATYSMGALYYNKAASLTSKINELSNDYSSEGTKKYNMAKKEMSDLFEKALPFFDSAEKLDPKDANTLIALKEIYARQGKFDKSNEYKAKLDKLQSK